jgi:hypothetical protein
MGKVVVYHSSYGCDSGCCGHVVEMGDSEQFAFSHPAYGDDYRKFAEDLVREEFGEEHVADLDWAECRVSDY